MRAQSGGVSLWRYSEGGVGESDVFLLSMGFYRAPGLREVRGDNIAFGPGAGCTFKGRNGDVVFSTKGTDGERNEETGRRYVDGDVLRACGCAGR